MSIDEIKAVLRTWDKQQKEAATNSRLRDTEVQRAYYRGFSEALTHCIVHLTMAWATTEDPQ